LHFPYYNISINLENIHFALSPVYPIVL
jgi:hypothetical protein